MAPVDATGAGQSLLQRAEYYAGIGQASNNRVAITLYRQALQADPESTPARRGLSRALAAQGCLFNGTPEQLREALALAEQELQRTPGDAAAHALWGYAQDCIGDMRQAITGYSRAIELEPGDERSRASLAYLQQERGQLATALQANLSLKAPERIRFRDVQVARELELLGFTQAAADRHARNFQLYPDNVFSNIAWPRSLYLAGAPQRPGRRWMKRSRVARRIRSCCACRANWRCWPATLQAPPTRSSVAASCGRSNRWARPWRRCMARRLRTPPGSTSACSSSLPARERATAGPMRRWSGRCCCRPRAMQATR